MKSAVTHVKCGSKLLHQTATTDTPASFVYIPQEMIRSLFTHLGNQLMELGNTSLLKMTREAERPAFSTLKDPETFTNLEDAYASFDILLNRTLRVTRTLDLLLVDALGFSDSETLLGIETERAKSLQYLDRWSPEFDQYLINNSPIHERSSDYNIHVLQIWRITAKFFLSVKYTDAEEIWDRFHGDFNTTVTLAEALVGTFTSHTTSPSFQGISSFSFSFRI